MKTLQTHKFIHSKNNSFPHFLCKGMAKNLALVIFYTTACHELQTISLWVLHQDCQRQITDPLVYPFSIDATFEECLCRFANDNWKQPNAKMRVLWIEGKTHLALFALREIYAGDEITYDYGYKKAHWRKVGLHTFIIVLLKTLYK